MTWARIIGLLFLIVPSRLDLSNKMIIDGSILDVCEATVYFTFPGSISAANIHKVTGINAEIKDFPYSVSIQTSDGLHYCGGSIIGERHVLTAAHCVEDMDEDEVDGLRIHSGTSKTNKIGNVHRISSVHVHPTYDSRDEVDGSDDIAVLTLKEPIVFNKYQQKINLTSQDVQNHQVAYLVGWGRTSRSSWESALQLQKLQVVLLMSETCKPFLTDTKIDEKQVCAVRHTGRAACQSDSGGPLVSHGEIVGVFSRGDTSFCTVGTPDIYANVFAYKQFIESVINK